MENENITQDVLENEEVLEETPTEGADTSVSDTNSDGSANVEDVSSDPVPEQSEETGSDVPSDTVEEETERTFTQEELEQIVTAVLTNEPQAEELEQQAEETEEVAEVPRTLFSTSFEEYTVSEGLLLCIFLLLFAKFIHSIFKGSHWFGKL